MNAAHLHLVVNHLPIIFPIVGIMVIITGLAFKSDDVKRMAFLIFVVGSLTSIAAMITGDGAEKVVEKMSGISEEYIKKHEESAELFSILTYILGGLALLGLWANIKQKTFSHIASIVVLLFALIVVYCGKETGTTGGEIRHTEIRSNNHDVPVFPKTNQPEKDND